MTAIIQHTNPLLPDYFALHAKWRSKKPALITDNYELNWAEFVARLNQVANGFLSSGLEKGDHVIIFMSNGGAMAECLFGCMMGGLVSAPLNTSVSDDAIVNMIEDSGSKSIIVTQDHVDRLNSLLPRLKNKSKTLLIVAEGKAQGWTRFETWRDNQPNNRPLVDILPTDFLNIIYSSGTTGQPKGIVHTHQGRRDWAYDLANALRYNSSSRFLATIGLYSNITWVGMLCTLISGGTLIINRGFDARALWPQIQNMGITHLSMVPVMYERMMDIPNNQDFDVSHMQGMMSAGSPLRPTIREKLFTRFQCGITELYGLTEGVITTLDPEDAEGRMSSVGIPILGSDLLILDENDTPCPPNVSGEICMATRFVMPGYLNRKEASLESLYVDPKGHHWLRTGDIGYLDGENFLYIVDRKKDMILSGGQNIYPQDIEAVLATHDDVEDVAVIGVKSHKWGETPLAIVSPANGGACTDDLRDWINARVGKQQRVAAVKIIDEIPRNPNGKILKRELRKLYRGEIFD